MKAARFTVLFLLCSIVSTFAGANPSTGWTRWARRPGIPRDTPSTVAWYRADLGITLGTTPLASGTTPPAVTISGALTQAIGLYIQCDGAGARGTATFKWSEDNGSTFRATGVLTAASVNIATTGGTIAVAFPVGTYATNNIYQGTVATWADQSGAGHNQTQATPANQPLYIVSGINSKPVLRFDGSNDLLAASWTLVQPVTFGMVHKMITNGASGVNDIVIDLDRILVVSDSTTKFGVNAGATLAYTTAVSNGAFDYTTLTFNGASSVFRVHGTQVKTGDIGTTADTNGVTIGGLSSNTRNTNFDIAEMWLTTAVNASADILRNESYEQGRYGL